MAREPDKARELAALLRAFDQDSARRSRWSERGGPVPDDVVEALRSLGYVQ